MFRRLPDSPTLTLAEPVIAGLPHLVHDGSTRPAVDSPGRPATLLAARCEQVVKIYGSGETRVAALEGVSIGFARAMFTAIMGPSGSGKSSLMHCMAGLDTVTSGRTFVADVDITELAERQLTELRRDRIGFVFQGFNLVPTLTAFENITLPMTLARRRPDKEWLNGVISAVGLGDRGEWNGQAGRP